MKRESFTYISTHWSWEEINNDTGERTPGKTVVVFDGKDPDGRDVVAGWDVTFRGQTKRFLIGDEFWFNKIETSHMAEMLWAQYVGKGEQ